MLKLASRIIMFVVFTPIGILTLILSILSGKWYYLDMSDKIFCEIWGIDDK